MTEIYELVKLENTIYFAWRLRNLTNGQYRYMLIFTSKMPFEIGLSGVFKFDYLSFHIDEIDWEGIAPGQSYPTNISMAIDYIVYFLDTNSVNP